MINLHWWVLSDAGKLGVSQHQAFHYTIYTCFATLILEWGKIVGTLGRVREEYFYRGWKTLHINNVIIFMPSVTSYLFNR